ncbi:MAG: hypothetical protein RLZZ428_739 [Pseudomonadota bacterium]
MKGWVGWCLAVLVAFGSETTLWKTKLEHLSAFEKYVIIDKGTEAPFLGAYVTTKQKGIYHCKVCDTPLYRSKDKFDSQCGWPSFDDAIPGAVQETLDADGRRVEITCAKCGAHLGHVFRGEGLTSKNTRHCVNSVSLTFEKKGAVDTGLHKAYFAGGCFWGVEYYMEKIPGVVEVTSGFMGGSVPNPTYEEVVRHGTGHLETVEVVYDPAQVSYEMLAKTFFEIHDPTQTDGQGPDRGEQYLSAIFVGSLQERQMVQRLIGVLESKGYKIATQVREKSVFYPAQAYHQDYYERKGTTPYCHRRIKRF